MAGSATVDRVRAEAFSIPTDFPESDGTLAWTRTTLIAVELGAGDHTGFGFTYGDASIARIVSAHAPSVLARRDAGRIAELDGLLACELRNNGRGGAVAMALSAVDIALWDLKGRRLGQPVTALLGPVRDVCPAYGSGGFTSYSDERLQEQFGRWRAQGFRQFKMKVGRDPRRDADRAAAARAAIGPDAELFVDANSAYGAFGVREAARWGRRFADEYAVTWFEEPLAPRDFAGLRLLRERLPDGIELAEGEYVYDADGFRELIAAEAADVLMADATRCGGVTGFLQMAALCAAWRRPLSSHAAPLVHAHLGCVAAPFRHAEYFHDHARIESLLFDGVPEVEGGCLRPPLDRPGFGWSFRWEEAKAYAA